MPALRETNATRSPERERVGLLAGWGRYPIVVAQALREQGHPVSCLGCRGHADPVLRRMCDDFSWLGLAQLGRAIRWFRRRGVRHATMAGKIHKVLIYQPWFWLQHVPDWRFLRTFYPLFVTHRKDRNDDALLQAVIDAFAEDGIRFGPATDYAPDLLLKPGRLAGPPPSDAQQSDIEFGWKLAKQMGGLDVGQSVCVKNRAALAVEAIEGTDACIRRAGELCRTGNFTVVKVAKPQQDMRFDVPTIGIGTLQTMVAARARVLAVEAGRTIILDQPQVAEYARQHKLIVVALADEGMHPAAPA